MIKNIFTKKNAIIFSFFLFGIIHWVFFFYFVDYYQYKKYTFGPSDFKDIKSIELSVRSLADKNLKRDKDYLN